ncbi:ATP-dependent helicase [Herbidospora galbida]|uniref:DNA 3'-5' helicase n=1 Tax=Herbidospora galbida TaxID=2575442 RepID=A0A4U3MAY8_9ACTN|nr:ATP-dependent helicase [Herbidospora galbida]TKK85800.1 ATP-dependent helicase [Herbidospora galbida]
MSEPFALTEEQWAVVDLPADALTLVTAEAGAGKTYTLARRLDRLVGEAGLGAEEILVLTFSRAAVRELRERLSLHGDAARHVRAQTFDSWALDMLNRVDARGEWVERSFEARIDGARQAIDDELVDDLYEHNLRHVVIDEVQDLVGARRELVEALLDRFECGFTIVGDPAQAIYGFTVKDPAERKGETNRFFEWLRGTFGEDLTELRLTHNFRARTDEARIALGFGPRLRVLSETGHNGGEVLLKELRDALAGVMSFGDFDGLAAEALNSHPGTTAILCRTNGQALLVDEQLQAIGVPHRLQRSARDRAVPAWLGMLMARIDASSLPRERFDEVLNGLPVPEGVNADLAWRLLRRTGSGRGTDRRLDLARVRSALAGGRLPDELTAQPPARVVVSSFHRAKGLEFDRVLIVDPGSGEGQRDFDPAEEARSLYVAMTRPRDELYRVPTIETRFVRTDPSTKRWGRYFFKRWHRLGLEVAAGDVTTNHPGGTVDFAADPAELQDYLATSVRPGDEVELRRLHPDPIGLRESPPYLVIHGDRPIATASERFRADLHTFLKLGPSYEPQHFPALISGVRVDAVETVAGDVATGLRAGLNDHGVWLSPRLVGLSTFIWDKGESDAQSQ